MYLQNRPFFLIVRTLPWDRSSWSVGAAVAPRCALMAEALGTPSWGLWCLLLCLHHACVAHHLECLLFDEQHLGECLSFCWLWGQFLPFHIKPTPPLVLPKSVYYSIDPLVSTSCCLPSSLSHPVAICGWCLMTPISSILFLLSLLPHVLRFGNHSMFCFGSVLHFATTVLSPRPHLAWATPSHPRVHTSLYTWVWLQCFSSFSANVPFLRKVTCCLWVPESDGGLVGSDILGLKKANFCSVQTLPLWCEFFQVLSGCLVHSQLQAFLSWAYFFESCWNLQLGFHWNSNPLSFLTHNVINLCNLIELHNYSNKHSWHEEVFGEKTWTFGRYATQLVRTETGRRARERGCPTSLVDSTSWVGGQPHSLYRGDGKGLSAWCISQESIYCIKLACSES